MLGDSFRAESRRRRGRSWLAFAAIALLFGFRVGGAADVRRPADDRPRHDDAALRELGIHRYESQRLVLYSDIDPAVAAALPPLIDAAYSAWGDYFGPLPAAEDGSEFQLTGYVMKDRGLFLDSGLLPEDLVDFQHGKHRGYRFWMAEQSFDYYRRHLLIHEATHCFMTIVPQRSRPPLFYQEGMAELFGTHAVDESGQLRFRVIPTDPQVQVGFGRFEMIQRACREGAGRSLDAVLNLSANDFAQSRSEPYAWSWALCQFLDAHPRYRERFRALAKYSDGDEFRRQMHLSFADDRGRLAQEWELFRRSIEYGYDIERSAIDFAEATPLGPGESRTVRVSAHQGWQCTGIQVREHTTCPLTATGEVTLAARPKPWISQPPGVTIRYSGGRPLGRLLGVIVPAPDDALEETRPLEVFDLGEARIFQARRTGQILLRVNDSWAELADNQGAYEVTVSMNAEP